MRKIAILLLLFCAVVLTIGSSDSVSGASGDHTLSGNIVLTEDMIFEDGSAITIASGTTIDVSSYTLSFGKDSTVKVMGSLTLKCTTGAIKMGSGTQLTIIDITMPTPTDDLSMDFDGTLSLKISSTLGYDVEVSFTPNGSDHYVNVRWNDSAISVMDPKVGITKNLLGSRVTIEFESIHFKNLRYDGESLIRTMDVSAGKGSLGLTISSVGVIINSLKVPAITVTNSYALSGITTTISVSGIGPVTIETDENMIQTISTDIQMVTFEREKDGKVLTKITIKDIDLSAVIDLNMLFQIFDHGDDYDPSAIIRTLELDAKTVQVEEESSDTVQIHNLCMTVQTVDPLKYLTVTMDVDGCNYSITVSRPEFSTFTLTKDLVMDMTMEIGVITIVRTEGDEKLTVTLDDTVLKVDLLDLLALFDIMSVQGTLTIQDVLNNCDLLQVSVGEMTVKSSTLDVKVDGLEALLHRDGRNINTLTIWFQEADVGTITDDGTLSLHFDKTSIVLESNSSMDETIDAIMSESHFTSDSHSMLTIYNSGFDISYKHDNSELRFMMMKSSELSPANISMSMSLDHYMYSDVTTVAAEFSTIGHELRVIYKEKSNGSGDDVSITFGATDIVSEITISFGDNITIDSTIKFLWSLDFYYHDIQFQADANATSLEISRGELDIEGYDRSEGIIPTIKSLSTKDFTAEMRISSFIDGVKFYNDDRKTVLNSYSDIEMDIRDLHIVMKRDDVLTIVLDGVRLYMLGSDGSVFNRELPHLEIVKELSEKPAEKNLLEELAPYLLGAFIGASVMLVMLLIYLRIKRPDLFKFTE